MTDLIRGLWGRPPAPRVVITAVVDGTGADVDSGALHRLQELRDAVRDGNGSIQATVDVYRGVAPPATGHLDKLLAGSGFPFSEVWSGGRSYTIQARALRKGDPHPQTLNEPPADALGRHLRENQQKYPDALHVVYAFGHRRDAQEIAGMPLPAVGKALDTGSAVGLVLVDTCWGASIDTLSHFPSTVQTVVASEVRLLDQARVDNFFTPVFETQFPLRRIALRLVSQMDTRSAAMGRTVVAEGSRGTSPHVIAAVDMHAFHHELIPALTGIDKSQAAQKARHAAPVDMAPGLGDLQGFLSALGASPAAASAHAASVALTRTLVARHASPDLAHLGGLSFHQQAGPAPLPESWQQFVGE